MRPGLLVAAAVGVVIGASFAGAPAAADDGLDARVAQLETTLACFSHVAPVATTQLHHSTKWALIRTNSGQDTIDHPAAYTWIVTMDPSCVKDIG